MKLFKTLLVLNLFLICFAFNHNRSEPDESDITTSSDDDDEDVSESDVNDEDTSKEVKKSDPKPSQSSPNSVISYEVDHPEETDENDEEDYKEDDDYPQDNDNHCSVCAKQLIESLKPDDYEANKNLTITKYVTSANETRQIVRRLKHWGESMPVKVEKLFKRFFVEQLDSIYDVDLPSDCLAAYFKIVNGIKNGRLWAYKFLDSSGSMLMSGQMSGGFMSLGEFDTCLSINESNTEKLQQPQQPILGQYCLAELMLPHPPLGRYQPADYLDRDEKLVPGAFNYYRMLFDLLNLVNGTVFGLGMCIPSHCRGTDLQRVINQHLFPLTKMPIEVNQCQTKTDPVSIDIYQRVSIITIATLFCLVVFSTILDVYNDRLSNSSNDISIGSLEKKLPNSKKPKKNSLVDCFSLLSSNRLLMASNQRFDCIDGVRFLATVNVVLAHYYLFFILHPAGKGIAEEDSIGRGYFDGKWKYAVLRNLKVVDVHFMISGLLLSYTLLGRLDRSKGRFNYLEYLVIMYLRFTPALIGSILFIYLLPMTGSGPLWFHPVGMVEKFIEPCKNRWLKSLLYISNFRGFIFDQPTCNGVSWWLSTAFQLHAFAPFLIIAMHKWAKQAITINISVILIGSAISIIPAFFGVEPIVETFATSSLRHYETTLTYHYFMAHSHINTFVFGILIGYLIRRHPNMKLGGWFGEWLILILALSLSYLSIAWLKDFTKLTINIKKTNIKIGDVIHFPADRWQSLLYTAFDKLMWTFGPAAVCFLCSTKRSPILNGLLSTRLFLPWSRLVMGLFLVHLTVLARRLSSVKGNFLVTDELILSAFCFDFVVSMVLAYVLYALFEAPVIKVIKLVVSGPRNEDNSKNNAQDNDKTLDNDRNNNNTCEPTNNNIVDNNKVVSTFCVDDVNQTTSSTRL